MRRLPLALLLLLGALAAGLVACGGDEPVPAAPKAAGGLVPTRVVVPKGMGAAPLDVPRTLLAPRGARVEVAARVADARFMAFLPDRSLLVSQPGEGQVTRIAGGRSSVWLSGLDQPHDLVVHRTGGREWIYVTASDRVVRVPYRAGAAQAGPVDDVVTGLPDASSSELRGTYAHALKNIALRGDELFVSIASSCNVCTEDTTSDPVRGAIYRTAADGSGGLSLVQRGVRNAEGLAFLPDGRLWLAINNRDNIPYPFHRDVTGDGKDDFGQVVVPYVDDHPPEELTPVRQGGDTGWPYCNPNPDGGLRDMPFVPDAVLNPGNAVTDCATKDRVAVGIQAHSAPLGLTPLTGTRLPARWRAGLAVAFHGSWNRSKPTGYKLVWFPWAAGATTPGAQRDLLAGFTANGGAKPWGRPVDAQAGPDGALYVSDDGANAIYRVTLTR